ncbi:hypothetical protein A9Q86_09310 [Flavobacteriales bacterium 33_180_T64]|nr:hypothetical protein A9Q86_09310 [Flavobacteriales bacterium 33_180_T64]
MKKLNNWLLANIFGISLYIVLTALFFEALPFFVDSNNRLDWFYVIFDVSYVHLNFFRSEVFSFHVPIDENSYTLSGYLNYVFYLLFLIAVIVYRFSKMQETKVLKFCYSIVFIFSIIGILFQVFMIFYRPGVLGVLFSLIYLFKAVFLTYISCLFLRDWMSLRVYIDEDVLDLPNFQKFTLKRADWYQRLGHILLDTFLILSIFSTYVFDYYTRDLMMSLDNLVGERFAVTLVFVFFSSIYYLIFEGLFKSTPAKFLTQTSVVNLKNEAVSFQNILGRTLCRRLPFNAFSFFGKLGWHDSLAYSTVAKHQTTPSKYTLVYIVFSVILIAFVLYRVLDEFRIL